MTRRPNVEEHPKGSGKFRVRTRSAGKLLTIVSGVSEAEADAAADAFVEVRDEGAVRDGVTLKAFGLGFLNRRERSGIRGIATDRVYWNKHVAGSELGALPVATIRRRDVIDWRDGLPLAYRSKKKALCLLRVALGEAVDRELLEANPARDVRVHRAADRSALEELSGVLAPAEQKALLKAVPVRERALVTFAMVTGLRRSEQWWLKWEDIGTGLIVVRRSVGGLPPKSGYGRTVHLLEPAMRALEHASQRTEFVWPGIRRGRRTKAPKNWRKWVTDAGITRRVRWHDLRHTCATALLAGWWGRKWSIDEVCQHLGHSSVTVTERYARKLAETNRLAVTQTTFPESSPLMLLSAGADSGIRTRDLRFTKARPSLKAARSYPRGGSPLGTSSNLNAWALGYAMAEVLRRAG
jgi:integrase